MLKKKRPACSEMSTQTGARAPTENETGRSMQAGEWTASEAEGSNDPREKMLSPQRQQHLLTVTEAQAEEYNPPPAEPLPIAVLSDMELLKDRNKVQLSVCCISWSVLRHLRHLGKATERTR